MVELYIKVKQPEVIFHNNYSPKNKIDALKAAAQENMNILKLFISTELQGSVISEHYLTPSLAVIIDDNKHSIDKTLQLLRSQPYIDVAEVVVQ